MKRYMNQLDCKEMNAGDILLNSILTDNLLIFVSSGSILFCNKKSQAEIKLEEGHFILLTADTHYIATAITQSHIQILQAGALSDMIINDPKWNPEQPVILPILPALAHTLNQIEYYQKNNYNEIN